MWIERYVFGVSKEKYSYSMIQKCCVMHSIKMSKLKVGDIINWKVKKCQSFLLHVKKSSNKYSKKERTVSNLSKNAGNRKKIINAEINYKVFKYICSSNK